MATRFEIVLAGDDPVKLRAAGELALSEIESCDAAWNRFRTDSEVSRVVRLAPRGAVPVSLEFLELIMACESGWSATSGAFDVTAGSGLGTSMADVLINVDVRTVAFRRPNVRLDFGAIAKGFALDRAARVLRESGVDCALMHGGTSSVVAIGHPLGQPGFRVLVPGGASVNLCDEALSVSRADSQMHILGESHVVDPRSQQPLVTSRGVAIIAPSGATAEIWSTALLVNQSLVVPPGLCAHMSDSHPVGRFDLSPNQHASRSGAEIFAHDIPIAS